MASVVRGALVGAGAGLLACVGGVSYFLENHGIPGIDWPTTATVFVTQLTVTGAAVGAAVTAALDFADGFLGRRTSWAPPLAAGAAMALVGFPSGAFGASYFGALHAPFMGTTAIFSIFSVIAIALAAALARLDQKTSVRRALLAALALAVPVVVIGGVLAASLSEREVLHAFRTTSVPLLGGASGATLAFVYGLYAGAVVGLVRRLPARPIVAPTRVRVEVEVKELEEEIDPLAEEEAELEARFAELERMLGAEP